MVVIERVVTRVAAAGPTGRCKRSALTAVVVAHGSVRIVSGSQASAAVRGRADAGLWHPAAHLNTPRQTTRPDAPPQATSAWRTASMIRSCWAVSR